jgi:hypothetical protein
MDRRSEDREEQQAVDVKEHQNKLTNNPNSPQSTMAMKRHLLLVSIVLSVAYGWMPQHVTPRTFVRLENGKDGPGDTASSTDMTNPCWQDFYDEDCESNFAAASFVAAKWIKGMPCGAGIEVGVASVLPQIPSHPSTVHTTYYLCFACFIMSYFASLLSKGLRHAR